MRKFVLALSLPAVLLLAACDADNGDAVVTDAPVVTDGPVITTDETPVVVEETPVQP